MYPLINGPSEFTTNPGSFDQIVSTICLVLPDPEAILWALPDPSEYQ